MDKNSVEEKESLINLFSMLSNPHRFQILKLLAEEGDMNVSTLLDHLEVVTPTALSNHLIKLIRSEVIDYRREHRHRYYYIRDERVWQILSCAKAVN